ncbi:sensor histidine kinase [Sphingobacterium faecale]|uniref:Histidine kinase n=1 Tax=Sphingobacterium faecale TaxID=2803775 RepID=A0ABS1R4Y6_9SPHI|nr:histidine kinase [Sphingobacterium faecale]MBL1408896.1 histidine kinase [Sphingobacterium faecale]
MKQRWVEFLLITFVYLFLLVVTASNIFNKVEQVALQLHLLTAYVMVSLYLLYVYPNFFSAQKMSKWVIWITCIFLIQSSLHYVIQSIYQLPRYKSAPPFVVAGSLLLALLSYTAIKTVILRLNSLSRNNSIVAKTLRNFLIALMVGTFLLIPIAFHVNVYICTLAALSIPFSYLLFATHNYFLLPYLEANKSPRTVAIVMSLLINLICIILFSSLMEIVVKSFNHTYNSFDGFNIIFCIILGALMTWLANILYNHDRKQHYQIVGLKKELGRTAADLRLLQSQINPHFLFNAMNTLFGLALQENAEKTASGIQKLGDMMRFMLHENQQDTILLAREIAYIKEYIELQQLRIANLPSIQISIDLPEDTLENLQIAPMLLIPFIENAFKHGISLNSPSWVRVQLYIAHSSVKLSVYNSIHIGPETDLEQNKSGIGLDNVKSRLNMIYNGQHELHMEKTNSEFFVFLTLNLNKDKQG